MIAAPLTVRARLAASFGALACAVLLIAGYSVKALSESDARFISYVEGISARAVVADKVRSAVDRRAIAARNMVLVTAPDDLEAEYKAVLAAHADVQSRLGQLRDMVAGGSGSSDRARVLVAEM